MTRKPSMTAPEICSGWAELHEAASSTRQVTKTVREMPWHVDDIFIRSLYRALFVSCQMWERGAGAPLSAELIWRDQEDRGKYEYLRVSSLSWFY